MTPRRQRTEINGVGLSWLELGPTDGKPLVMLHGMRDVAWSLLPVAETFAGRFRVILPELRGHGDSDRPGAYTIDHLLYDLYRLTEHLRLGPAILFGHSLGGQIIARYAAAFPDRARAAVLVEGLGPPARPGEDDPARQIRDHGQRLLNVLDLPASQRPLPGVEFAAERLLANNPRLDPARAQELAARATRRNAEGELEWAFDPRVPSVFLSVRREDTERYWRQVTCPTLIVSGGLAAEYWRAQMPLEWDGEFAPGELRARVALFPDAEHVAVANAGHMVHFDQCETLTRAVADFLERRL